MLLFWGVECCCCLGPWGSKLFCWAFGILVSVPLSCRASNYGEAHSFGNGLESIEPSSEVSRVWKSLELHSSQLFAWCGWQCKPLSPA